MTLYKRNLKEYKEQIEGKDKSGKEVQKMLPELFY